MIKILYFRSRPSAGSADAEARRQQIRSAREFLEDGGVIAGCFTEIEAAPPGYGREEAAHALQAAIRCVRDVLRSERFCTLAILRVDGIGGGDPFDVEHPYFTQLLPVRHRILIMKTGWTAMNKLMELEWRNR